MACCGLLLISLLVNLSRLFRSLNVKVPLTTIGFSPEGAAIYLGTENGKILVIDLRALDKPPKAVVVSETGNRIETISIQVRLYSHKVKLLADAYIPQKRLKPGTEGSAKAPAGSSSTAIAKSPPTRPRVGKVGAAKEAGTPSSTLKRAATTSNIETKKKVFSPVRDPHGNSGSTGDISGKF